MNLMSLNFLAAHILMFCLLVLLFYVCMVCIFGLAVLQELARQIKVYQDRINELSEKSHVLVERGADLGDLCVRKLFHTGYRDTTVSELVDAMNAPLEPYVSPLSSPRSPYQTQKYHYECEDPLKFHRSTDGHLHRLSGDDETPFRSGKDKDRESDSLTKSLPSLTLKTPPSKTDRGSLRNYARNNEPSALRDNLALSPTDSGVNVSSHGSGLSDLKSLVRSPRTNDIDIMEVATSVPKSYATFPSKRSYKEDRQSGDLPSKYKSLKTNESLESASVRTGSTDEPGSSVSQSLDATTSASRQYPYGSIKSSADKDMPSWKKTDSSQAGRDPRSESPLERIRAHQQRSKYGDSKHADGQDDSNKSMTQDELKSLKARKVEALTPYSSKYYHIAAIDKDSGDERPQYEGEFDSLANDFEKPGYGGEDADMMQAETEEPVFSRYGFKSWKPRSSSQESKTGPLRAEHGKYSQFRYKDEKPLDRSRSASPRSGRDSDSSPDYFYPKGRSRRPPSPLTSDSQDETVSKSRHEQELPRGSMHKSGMSQWAEGDKEKLPSWGSKERQLGSFKSGSHGAIPSLIVSPGTSSLGSTEKQLGSFKAGSHGAIPSLNATSGTSSLGSKGKQPGSFKSGSHGAIPSLTVTSDTASPVARFSSGDRLNRNSWSMTARGGREDPDRKSSELSKSLTNQGMKTLFSRSDRHKPGYGLLQPGQRETVGG